MLLERDVDKLGVSRLAEIPFRKWLKSQKPGATKPVETVPGQQWSPHGCQKTMFLTELDAGKPRQGDADYRASVPTPGGRTSSKCRYSRQTLRRARAILRSLIYRPGRPPKPATVVRPLPPAGRRKETGQTGYSWSR